MSFLAVINLSALLCIFAACNSNHPSAQQLQTPEQQERTLRNFILHTSNASKEDRNLQLDTILNNAAKDSSSFRQTIAYLSKPLSHPNSVYHNENLYIKLLQYQLQSPWYNSAEKIATQNKLTLVMQNRVGNPANDFTYITPNGKKKRLYDISANHTLVFFYNPECDACKATKAALMTSATISKKIKSGNLKILAIYTDKDETIWRKHLPKMPNQWIHGGDEDEYLWKNKVYDLKAIPTIYLLDKEKKVALKDCMDVRMIEKRLREG